MVKMMSVKMNMYMKPKMERKHEGAYADGDKDEEDNKKQRFNL